MECFLYLGIVQLHLLQKGFSDFIFLNGRVNDTDLPLAFLLCPDPFT